MNIKYPIPYKKYARIKSTSGITILRGLFLFLILACTDFNGNAQLLSYTNATNGTLATNALNTTGTGLIRVNGATLPASPCSTGFSSTNFSNTLT